MLNANESKHIRELSHAKLSKTTFWDETQSVSIISMIQDSGHFILEGVKNVVGLQHTSKKVLSLQNTYQNIEGFDELFNNTLIIRQPWGNQL
jgi:uncharacterized protein YbcV (DUF1398 family)